MAKKNKRTNEEVAAATITPTVSKSTSAPFKEESDLIYGKRNYAFMLLGMGLIVLGYFLMAGGNMPSPDVWDDSTIYSFRRTVLAPFLVLAGLGVQFFTIFGKKA